MAKITTDEEKIAQLEMLFPDVDATYGTAYLPRNFVPPMSELLQWPEATANDSDYKKPGQSFKDKISKSGTTFSKRLDSHWITESHDNYRGFLYNPESGKLYPSNFTLIIDILTPDNNETLKIKREVLEDEEKDMYATEYKKAFTTIVNPPVPQPVIPEKRATRGTTKSKSKSRTHEKSKERKVEKEDKTEEILVQNVKKDTTVKKKTVKKELNEDINKEQEKAVKKKPIKSNKTITEKASSLKEVKPLQEHAKTVKKEKTETVNEKEQGTKKKVTWAKQLGGERVKPFKTVLSTSKPEPKPLSKSIPT